MKTIEFRKSVDFGNAPELVFDCIVRVQLIGSTVRITYGAFYQESQDDPVQIRIVAHARWDAECLQHARQITELIEHLVPSQPLPNEIRASH